MISFRLSQCTDQEVISMEAPSELEKVEFADNPEARCPVAILLDTSSSMAGSPIAELNQGLKSFSDSLKEDKVASLRVEVGIITFGGNVQALDARSGNPVAFDAQQVFATVDNFYPPTLTANGNTPMGEATRRAVTLLRDRKEIYKRNDIDYYRPWMVLITDGQPTDVWEASADQVREEENQNGLIFFGIGVEGANLQTLARFSDQREPLKLKGLAFEELFVWLSKSLAAGSRAGPRGQAPLPPIGWAQIDT
jgi:uncharacterized protein YegL